MCRRIGGIVPIRQAWRGCAATACLKTAAGARLFNQQKRGAKSMRISELAQAKRYSSYSKPL